MAADVVDIKDAPSHESKQPHAVEHVMCTECGNYHVSVRPLACPLEKCECVCGRVGTLEVLTKREINILGRIARLEERVAMLDGKIA